MSNENPYSTPNADIDHNAEEREIVYVGFWLRVAACLIDTLLLIALVMPLFFIFGGEAVNNAAQGVAGIVINYILPAAAIILFWIYKSATPGKMAVGAKIVDAGTGLPASKGQLIGRYFAYYLSMIPLFLGFLWVAFDKRKQGWHDKLAGTIVVKK